MYIPEQFRENSREKLIAFMKENSFAAIISSNNNQPEGTHLPFLVEEREDKIYLLSHYASENPQWKRIKENEEVMILFQGPHSYISPASYESKVNVPTWNYTAVHAYGRGKILSERSELISILEKMFDTYEKDFIQQWEELPTKYIDELLQWIKGIEIEIIRIEGVFKLSQNKSRTERENIIKNLESSKDQGAVGIAAYMKKSL